MTARGRAAGRSELRLEFQQNIVQEGIHPHNSNILREYEGKYDALFDRTSD